MRKLLSLLAAAAVLAAAAAPAMAAENTELIAAEDAAAMAEAGLPTNVPASSTPSEEVIAADEEAAGVHALLREEAAQTFQPDAEGGQVSQPDAEGGQASGTAPQSELPFTDVSADNPYYAYILYAYRNSLFLGYSNNTFGPGGSMTRAMFVTVLYRQAAQLGQDMSLTRANPFTDTANSNQEFQTAIQWAAERGIVNGKTATTFAPNEAVNRQQACAILTRYLEDFLRFDLSAFKQQVSLSDGEKVSSYAREAVPAALTMGLIDTDSQSDGTAVFRPWQEASRAVVAKMIAVTVQTIPSLTKRAEAEPVQPVNQDSETPAAQTDTDSQAEDQTADRTDQPADQTANGGTDQTANGGTDQTANGGTDQTAGRTDQTAGRTDQTDSQTSGGSGQTSAPDSTPKEEHTEEEIAQEQKTISFFRNMLSHMEEKSPTDPAVKDMMDRLTVILREVISASESGTFIDREYLLETYGGRMQEFFDLYGALSGSQRSQAQEYLLSSTPNLMTLIEILEYFGVNISDYI